jgi:hypothetical protein
VCYSAQVKQAYQEYVRMFGAEIDIREFVKLYASREMGAKVRLPRRWMTPSCATLRQRRVR